MTALLSGVLAALSWLGRLSAIAKFLGIFSKLAAFIPGAGPIVSVMGGWLGAIAGFIPKFIAWTFEDISDAFSKPQRIVVRLVFALAVLGVGVHAGIKWDHHKLEAANQKITTMVAERNKANADAEARVAAAEKARKAAESAARVSVRQVPTSAVVPAAAHPKRVRKPKPAKPADSCGSGLFGLPPLFGKPCKG
jgi:hypothetical protein